MSDRTKQPDGAHKIWDEPVADESHTRTYEVKDAERDSMTDEKGSNPAGAPASEIAAESIEPVPAAAPAQSQAVLDIQEAGLTPEEAVAASKALADANDDDDGARKAKKSKSKRPENLAAVASFRWLVLLILSIASVATWAVDSQFFSHRPYNLLAWGVLAATVVLGLLSFKIFRLPTRSGLAALGWSATFFIDALYGPSSHILDGIPAVLPWAGLLTLIFIWVLVAIWRKLGHYTVIDIILGLVLLYAAVGILWAPLDAIISSRALSIDFNVLTTSPTVISDGLPWVMWPMTIMVFFILPLAVFFALWDQGSALRRKGGRHGGNFFLALAFIGLLPYAFLVYDKAVEENPALVKAVRSIYPAATAVASTKPSTPAPAPKPAAETAAVSAAPSAFEAVVESVAAPAEKTVEAETTPPVSAPEETPPAQTPAQETASAEQVPVAAVIPEPVTAVPAQAPVEAAPLTPAVDPAVISALEERLKETETRLQATEDRLKDTAARLEKAEAGLEKAGTDLAAATSGLNAAQKKADKKVNELEKQIQELQASPPDLDAAIDQRIQSLPGSARSTGDQAETTAAQPTGE